MHSDRQIAATTNELTNYCPHRAKTYIFCGKYRITRKKKKDV
nr:unnamed protein product [Callosobruchus chinensis]